MPCGTWNCPLPVPADPDELTSVSCAPTAPARRAHRTSPAPARTAPRTPTRRKAPRTTCTDPIPRGRGYTRVRTRAAQTRTKGAWISDLSERGATNRRGRAETSPAGLVRRRYTPRIAGGCECLPRADLLDDDVAGMLCDHFLDHWIEVSA